MQRQRFTAAAVHRNSREFASRPITSGLPRPSFASTEQTTTNNHPLARKMTKAAGVKRPNLSDETLERRTFNFPSDRTKQPRKLLRENNPYSKRPRDVLLEDVLQTSLGHKMSFGRLQDVIRTSLGALCCLGSALTFDPYCYLHSECISGNIFLTC